MSKRFDPNATVSAAPGDVLVGHGCDPVTGHLEGTLLRQDGTAEEVVATGEVAGRENFYAVPDADLGPDIYRIESASSTGHRGPALANSGSFRERIVAMFGEHRLDPNYKAPTEEQERPPATDLTLN